MGTLISLKHTAQKNSMRHGNPRDARSPKKYRTTKGKNLKGVQERPKPAAPALAIWSSFRRLALGARGRPPRWGSVAQRHRPSRLAVVGGSRLGGPWLGGVGVAEKNHRADDPQNNYPVLGLYIGLLFAITTLNPLCFSRLCLTC